MNIEAKSNNLSKTCELKLEGSSACAGLSDNALANTRTKAIKRVRM